MDKVKLLGTNADASLSFSLRWFLLVLNYFFLQICYLFFYVCVPQYFPCPHFSANWK